MVKDSKINFSFYHLHSNRKIANFWILLILITFLSSSPFCAYVMNVTFYVYVNLEEKRKKSRRHFAKSKTVNTTRPNATRLKIQNRSWQPYLHQKHRKISKNSGTNFRCFDCKHKQVEYYVPFWMGLNLSNLFERRQFESNIRYWWRCQFQNNVMFIDRGWYFKTFHSKVRTTTQWNCFMSMD